MLKNNFLVFIVIGLVALLSSCKDKIEKTPSGLRYQYHERYDDGKKAKFGEVLLLHYVIKTSTDSILGSTYRDVKNPVPEMIRDTVKKGGLEEALTLLAEGDSVSFFLHSDSLLKNVPAKERPKGIAKGSDIKYTIKVVKIQSMEAFQKSEQEKTLKKQQEAIANAGKQKEIDAKAIADYISKNKIANVQKTPSGLHYIITQEGTGKKPVKGDTVSVHYVLKLMNGTQLESSKEKGQPMEYPTGIQAMIPGFDEGIALLKKGSKATLLVPSGLAYGANSGGPIPPNSILIFDVELVDVK